MPQPTEHQIRRELTMHYGSNCEHWNNLLAALTAATIHRAATRLEAALNTDDDLRADEYGSNENVRHAITLLRGWADDEQPARRCTCGAPDADDEESAEARNGWQHSRCCPATKER